MLCIKLSADNDTALNRGEPVSVNINGVPRDLHLNRERNELWWHDAKGAVQRRPVLMVTEEADDMGVSRTYLCGKA